MHRLRVLPIEAGLAIIIMGSSFLALIKYGGVQTDVLAEAFPWSLLFLTQSLYFLGGLNMTLGIGFGRRDIEAFGLAFVVAGLVVRSIGIVYVVGLHASSVTSLFFNFVFAGACCERFLSLRKGEVVVKAEGLE